MNKSVFLVYGCVGLIGHYTYIEMHDAMRTITKPGVTSIDGYISPVLHDLGSDTATSMVYHLIG
jgi:hypothetical protein